MIAKVKEYHQTFRSIMKSYQSKKNSAAFQPNWKSLKMKAKNCLISLHVNVKIWKIAFVLRSLKSRLWKEVS